MNDFDGPYPDVPPGRPLVIVRDEAKLYGLVASPDIAADAILILDRREGSRRREVAHGTVERRVADRRRRDVSEAVRHAGFAIVPSASHSALREDVLA